MKKYPQNNTVLYKQQYKDKNAYNLVMAFPACKSFALSSLGYLWLFKKLDENSSFNISQVYTDSTNFPNVNEINAISFSISYEMDFMGIFEILEKLNIPIFANSRERILLFAGGPVITSNPAPFANIFDFFLIGDGEELLLKVTNLLNEKQNDTKQEILNELATIEGVYIPSLHNKAIKQNAPLNECIYTPIISEEAYFSNTFIIEVERGCYNRCGFCLASYLNLPVRYADYDEIIEKIELGLKYTNNIALLGAQVSAHPRFKDICNYVINKIENGENININFSSLRIDAINDDVIKLLKISGQKTFTVAIEAATERLRKFINKNISEENLFKALEYASNGGMQGVKIYCMIGLPTETEKDINAFIDLAKRLKNLKKGFEITFSFSSFVPKPHTPFQWYAKESTSSIEQKQKYLTKELTKLGIKVKFSSAKWDYYQTLISRGDETLGDYLYKVYKLGGKIGNYKSVAKELNINTEKFVTRNYDLEENLPWDNIIIEHPGKELLKKEFERLKKYQTEL